MGGDGSLQLRKGLAQCTIAAHRGAMVTSWLSSSKGSPCERLFTPKQWPVTGWPGGGIPILFPFAGRVWTGGKEGQYAWLGETYPMPLHGFLTERQFAIESQSADVAVLRYRSAACDRAVFPFEWDVRVTISLPAESSLRVACEVINLTEASREAMPLSLGVHPFWRLPEDVSSCRLDLTADGFRVKDGRKGDLFEAQFQSLPVTDDRLRSAILGNANCEKAGLDLGAYGFVTTKWRSQVPMKYWVIWSSLSEKYFCLESWMGAPDAVHNGDGLCFVRSGEACQVAWDFELA